MTAIGTVNEYSDIGAADDGVAPLTSYQRSKLLKTLRGSRVDLQSFVSTATTTQYPSVVRGLLTTLRTRIIAAGSTVSDAQLNALAPHLDRLVKTTAWPKILDMWIPVGSSLAGALVKLKAHSTAGTSCVGIGLVAGDYTEATGITGDGASKAINTGLNPTTAGAAAASWGFGVHTTNTANNAGSILAGASGGTDSYIGFQTTLGSQINGTGLGNNSQPQYPRWSGLQIGGGSRTSWMGGHNLASVAGATGTLTNSVLHLLSAGGAFWSNQTTAGYAAWSPALTAAEMRELALFFDGASCALWRSAWKSSYVACGDSNTAGFNLGSPATERYSAVFAAALGLTEDNQGYNNTSLTDRNGYGAASSWFVDYGVQNASVRAGSLMSMMIGTNDDRYGASMTTFESNYRAWMDRQIATGVDSSMILLLSPVATTDALSSAVRQQRMRDIAQTIASDYGAGFLDTWALTNGQTSWFQADRLHLNATGDAAIVTSGMLPYWATLMTAGAQLRTSW